MEKYIFEQNKINTKKVETKEEFFTIAGSEDFVDDNNNPRINVENNIVYAKRILRDDGSYRYSIKTSSSGKLYNPLSIYDSENNKYFIERICRSADRFRNVNSKSFDLYLNFLRTKNVAWLNNAEREAE